MMDETGRVIYGILLLILVGSALLSRRIPMSQMVKMIVAWIFIFTIMFLLIEIASHIFPENQEEYAPSSRTIASL